MVIGAVVRALAGRLDIPPSDDGLPGAGPIRRAEWFQHTWTERRTHFAERAAREHGAVVFLGDSITQGLGDEIAGAFPGLKTANRGISGDTTRGVLIRLDEDVLELDPVAVVLLIGTNDLEERAEPEVIAGNLKLILAKLKAKNPRMPVVLCEVFPSSSSMRRPADKIRKINALYAAAVKGDAQVTLLETYSQFANSQGDARKEEFDDLLHPNAKGNAMWMAAVRPILATLGLIENEADAFKPEPGFKSLFNGKNLNGWGFRPTPEEDIKWSTSDPNAPPLPIVRKPVRFSGLTASPDGRYVARNGRLIVTTPPEGRRIQRLSTTREFQRDFILKLEFRATPNADSGIFIRDPQLQCRDYLVAGPYKQLKHYKAQDWNEIVVEVHGRTALCTCNGEVLEGSFKLPANGPIGLEGDRGQMEYRRIRIKEIR
jgi:lysophospholipase L1-like esterase